MRKNANRNGLGAREASHPSTRTPTPTSRQQLPGRIAPHARLCDPALPAGGNASHHLQCPVPGGSLRRRLGRIIRGVRRLFGTGRYGDRKTAHSKLTPGTKDQNQYSKRIMTKTSEIGALACRANPTAFVGINSGGVKGRSAGVVRTRCTANCRGRRRCRVRQRKRPPAARRPAARSLAGTHRFPLPASGAAVAAAHGRTLR